MMQNQAEKDGAVVPAVSYEEADARAQAILQRMSLDEKIELVGGHNLFYIKGFEAYGIPQLYLADSTQGVHIRPEVRRHMDKSTAFPCPLALAATWNPQLAYRYAQAVGQQCRAGDVAVLLGPGVNIYRISQCGRNFEYFGEDPFLAAQMAEQYVRGVQSTGTIATLKHFLCNNSDHRRRRSNSVVDERTLHEIYLPAFEAGIRAGAMAVMTSYNQFNGEWTGQSREVITDLLRGELGFKWLVMTDWWSIYEPLKAVRSGLDLDMPGEPSELFSDIFGFGDIYVKTHAKKLLADGQITESDIERMGRGVLRTMIAAGLLDRPVKDETLTARYPEHEQIALETARQSVVLLRNEDSFLPIAPNGQQTILLTGWFADEIARGRGAAEVEGYDEVTLVDAMTAMYGKQVRYVKTPTDADLAGSDAVIVCVGTIDSEGFDRPFDLPKEMNGLVERAASANPNTMVIVYSGSGVNMSGWNERVRAILYAWYPGQNGNAAVAEILSGRVSPSGRLPMTIEKTFADSPGYGYIGDEPLDTDFFADTRLDVPIRDIRYLEGVFVGYRWYESRNIAPLYPFGFGLSYTSFAYSDLLISVNLFPDGIRVRVECTVTNTGKSAGAEVVQLYVRPENPPVPRPVKELKGVCRLTLQPGQSQRARFELTERDFAYWDTQGRSWRTEAGNYSVLIGSSSAAICLSGTVEMH